MKKRDHAELERRQTIQREFEKQPPEVREYWTADRMRSATPVELERQKKRDGEADKRSNP